MKHEEKVSKNEFDVNDNIADALGGRHKDSDDLKDKNIDNIEVFNNDGKGSGIFHVLKVLRSTFTTICNLPLTVTMQSNVLFYVYLHDVWARNKRHVLQLHVFLLILSLYVILNELKRHFQ